MKNLHPLVRPTKIYTTLARACRYGQVLPNFVQPVFKTNDGIDFYRVGFAVGPAKLDGQYISYRA